jgi:hypothetical protein
MTAATTLDLLDRVSAREAVDLSLRWIDLETLRREAVSLSLVWASPRLATAVLQGGELAYLCPRDWVVLFSGDGIRYRLRLSDWARREWCAEGCNHFRVYVLRRGTAEAARVRVGGRHVYAVLDGETVRFVVAARTGGLGAPWRA